MSTRGVVYVHSCPLAVCPHVEWALARALAAPVSLEWSPQPLDTGARRAVLPWRAPAGAGAYIAAELRQWTVLRFEVSEEPSPGCDGERFMYVPGRGLFRAATGAAGDIRLGEDQLRAIMGTARGPESLSHALSQALGSAWDDDLEPYRRAADSASPATLTRVG